MNQNSRDRQNRSRRRRGRSGRPKASRPPQIERVKHVPKQYAVMFFETLDQAKKSIDQLKEAKQSVDQLNIVIRAEAPMTDEELLQIGNLYAGEAWTIIHERRKEEGWYDSPV